MSVNDSTKVSSWKPSYCCQVCQLLWSLVQHLKPFEHLTMSFWHFEPLLKRKVTSSGSNRGKGGYAAFKDNPHSREVVCPCCVVMHGSTSGLHHFHLYGEPVSGDEICSLGAWNMKEGIKERGVKEQKVGKRKWKWGQLEGGRFSLWHVSWWKDHFSPYLGIVFFPSTPPSLRLAVPLITHLPQHWWDGRNGYPSRNCLSPLLR